MRLFVFNPSLALVLPLGATQGDLKGHVTCLVNLFNKICELIILAAPSLKV